MITITVSDGASGTVPELRPVVGSARGLNGAEANACFVATAPSLTPFSFHAYSERVARLHQKVLKSMIPPEMWVMNLDLSWRVAKDRTPGHRGRTFGVDVTVVYKGDFLKTLHKFCLGGVHKDDDLRSEIKLLAKYTHGERHESAKVEELTTARLRQDGVVSGKIRVVFEENHLSNSKWTLELLLVDNKTLERLERTLHPSFVKYWRIMKEKPGDFTLVAGNGKRFPCQKHYLAESPVLETMINSSFLEGANNEAHLKEMTAEGIEAFLEYLYCGVVINAKEDAHLAVELFKAGHKYMLPALEEEAKDILVRMDLEFFDCTVCDELSPFLENDEENGEAEQILKFKVAEAEQRSIRESFPHTSSRRPFGTGGEDEQYQCHYDIGGSDSYDDSSLARWWWRRRGMGYLPNFKKNV